MIQSGINSNHMLGVNKMSKKKHLTFLIAMVAIGAMLSGCGHKIESSIDPSFAPSFTPSQAPSLTPSQASVEEAKTEQSYIYNKYLINPYIARTLNPDEQLYKRLFAMVENADEQVDLSDLVFDQDTFDNTVKAIMNRLEFPYIKKLVLEDGKNAVASYTMDKESALAAQYKLRSKVEGILSTEVSPSQSQTLNALALYGYLVQNVSYASDDQGTGGYDALVNGTAICYGYSYALVYLMDQIGIEAHLTSSIDESHMWVIAKLDGEYRHLDPTNGWAQFGLSDKAQKRNYDDWYCGNVNYVKETPPACTDEAFDFLLDSYAIEYNKATSTLHYTDAMDEERDITFQS